jgi:hypothetical protein
MNSCREIVALGISGGQVQARVQAAGVVSCAPVFDNRKGVESLNVSSALMENVGKLRSWSVRKGIFAATRST